MKNNRGFTLIELMIAIAIIGILALVLIPRVGGLKDNARESGLDTNVRMAVSIAESLVDKAAGSTEADLVQLEEDIAAKITASGMKNPFSKSTAVNDDITTPGAFGYADDSANEETDDAGLVYAAQPENLDLAGEVLFDAYLDGTLIKVKFVPMNSKGAPIVASIATTN